MRSLGGYNVEVIDKGKLTPLTATHVGDTMGLIIKRGQRLDNLSCLCLF